MQNRRLFTWVGGLIMLMTLACSLPTVPDIGLGPAPTPTPIGNSIEFWTPTYTAGLSPGEMVPGARLEYVGLQESGVYQVKIDGQPVVKRNADSFFWNGVMAPGVIGNYELRVGAEILGALQVAGPLTVSVLNPLPIEITSLPIDATYWNFKNFVVDYRVPVGHLLPGTPILFTGTQVQGENTLAILGNSSDYTQLAFGDSMVYNGQLLDNVFIRYSLRTSSIEDDVLRLTGTAELWIR
ncbi:MAG: hypothetical protein AAF490_22850 [Chloroflexota bacterium]